LESIVGKSKEIREVLELIRRLAQAGASTLLVQGESGTGKDLVSRALHYESARRDNPFFALNCAAIPETLIETELFGYEKGAFTDAKTMKKGVFEMADRGTVFLDEISEMHLNMQSKFLRVLEDQTFRRVGGVRDISVDGQVVASTNRDLEQAVREGKFREDLFYRLSVIPVQIPPLRQRKEDIPLLVDHFIQRYNTQFRKNVEVPPGIEVAHELFVAGKHPRVEECVERAMILVDRDSIDVDRSQFGCEPAGGGLGRPGENFETCPGRLAWTTSRKGLFNRLSARQWQQTMASNSSRSAGIHCIR
jgi:transcriptional regulator with PAS, ATPase and Fis domain